MIAGVRSCLAGHPDRRANLIGAGILFLLVNLTFFPFVWGNLSLQDSEVIPSLYLTGSRPVATANMPANREMDVGAPAWQTEPWFVLEHHIILHEKTAPLWNPYSAFGSPLAANMQSQPYSPFAWVAIIFDSPRGYDVFVVLRIYAAGLLAFLFLRQFVGLWPALVGGASFMYVGYLWLYLTMPEVSVEVVIPGLLLGMERLLRKQSPGRIVALAVFLALAVFGGMPESLIFAVAFAYAYGIARILGDASIRTHVGSVVPAVVASSVLGACFSAIQIVPFFEYLPLSSNVHAGASIGLDGDPWFAFTPALYLAPLLHGPPANNIFTNFTGFAGTRGFFGSAVAFFALVAVVNRLGQGYKGRRLKVPIYFFTLYAAFCLLKRFGVPAVNWVGALPGFRGVDFGKYEEATLGCAIAVLAGFGSAALLERRVTAFQSAIAAAIPLTILTVAFAVDRTAYLGLDKYQTYYAESLLCALSFLALAFLLALSSRTRWCNERSLAVAAPVLVVLQAHVGYIVPMFYIVDSEGPQSASTYYGAPYVSFLQQRLRNGERVLGRDNLFYPEWSAAFRIPDVRGLDGLFDSHYLQFVTAFLPVGQDEELVDRFVGTGPIDFGISLEQRFLSLSSIRYIVSAHQVDAAGPLANAIGRHPELVTPKLRLDDFSIAGRIKSALFVHPPLERFPAMFAVPSDARYLEFSIGMLPDVWKPPPCGDGVRFSLDVRAGGVVRRVWQRYIDPKHDAAERRWIPQRISISRYRGRHVELLLSTMPGPSGMTCSDWAVWSEIRLDPEPQIQRESPFHAVYRETSVVVSEFSHPLPRVAIYQHVRVAPDDESALAQLAAPGFDPRSEVVVQTGAKAVMPLVNTARRPVSAGTITTYRSRLVETRFTTSSVALVELNDTFFPGWNAYLDGRPATILRANYLFRGVVVGPGKHVLVFKYEPVSFAVGSALSLLAAAVAVALLVAPRLRRRRPYQESSL